MCKSEPRYPPISRRRRKSNESRSYGNRENQSKEPSRRRSSSRQDHHKHRHRGSSSNFGLSKRRTDRRSGSRSDSGSIGNRGERSRYHRGYERNRSRSHSRGYRYRGEGHRSDERRGGTIDRRKRTATRYTPQEGAPSLEEDRETGPVSEVAVPPQKADTTSLLLDVYGEQSGVNLGVLNDEFKELNYSRAYGIDVSSFSFVQSDIFNVELPRENKPLSTYERRQRRKEEILKHPDRFWKCKKCESMNYLSAYECTRCQQLRNANY